MESLQLNEALLSLNFWTSTTDRIISRMIRWVTRGRVSHSGHSYRDPLTKKIRMFQAESHGYEVIPWRRWLQKGNRLYKRFAIKPESWPKLKDPLLALQNAEERLGELYDFGVVGLLFYRWRKYRNPFRSSRIQCTEAEILFARDIGLSGIEKFDVESTSPEDWTRFLESHPDLYEVKEDPNA